jgi:hypothetical protein
VRPPIDDAAVKLLRSEVPDFEDHYLDLIDIYDEDLTPEIVFMELADFVANLVTGAGSDGSLERCLAAIEQVAATTDEGGDLVAYSFLNELPAWTRAPVMEHLGPVGARLAERLYGDEAADSGGQVAAARGLSS